MMAYLQRPEYVIAVSLAESVTQLIITTDFITITEYN